MTNSPAFASNPVTPTRRLHVGVAGLGAGAVQVIRAMANTPYIQLTAAADVRPEALAAFTSRFQGRTYASVEALCRDSEVEVALAIMQSAREHREVMLSHQCDAY